MKNTQLNLSYREHVLCHMKCMESNLMHLCIVQEVLALVFRIDYKYLMYMQSCV